MKNKRRLTIGMILALAGLLLAVGPSWAQCRRGDYTGAGPGSQWCQGGGGPGYGQAYQGSGGTGNLNCPRPGGGKYGARGSRGPRGGNYQPQTNTPAPVPTQ